MSCGPIGMKDNRCYTLSAHSLNRDYTQFPAVSSFQISHLQVRPLLTAVLVL